MEFLFKNELSFGLRSKAKLRRYTKKKVVAGQFCFLVVAAQCQRLKLTFAGMPEGTGFTQNEISHNGV